MNKAIVVLIDDGTNRRNLKKDIGDPVDIEGRKYYIEDELYIDEDLFRLKSLLKENEDSGRLLLFDKFGPFKRAPEKLKLLKEYQIPFRFEDFKNLNPDTLDTMIEYLQFVHKEQSQKIKEALKEKRKEGVTLGNPDIGKERSRALRARKIQAWENESNRDARKIIVDLRFRKSMNYNQIAERLNEMGKTPRRGKQYYAKTVQRLLQSEEELQGTFKRNSKLEKSLHGALVDQQSAGPRKELPVVGLSNNASFKEVIKFALASPLEEMFEVLIFDNQDSEHPIFRGVYEAGKQEVSIDLEEHLLLPGTHYISIKTGALKYKTFKARIYLRPHLLTHIPPGNERGQLVTNKD